MSLPFTKFAVGVDCSGGAVTLTVLGRRFRHFMRIAELRLAEPLEEDASRQVAAFLDRHRLREVRAIACLPRDAALVRFLDLPAEAEPQLAKIVGYQLSSLHPFQDDQVYWDCAIVDREVKAKQVSVMVVVGERSRVDQCRQTLEKLGLRLSGITLAAAALAPLLQPLLPATPSIIVSGRTSSAELLSFRQGHLCATQAVPLEPYASARERFEREWHRALAALPGAESATPAQFACGQVPGRFAELLPEALPLPAPKFTLARAGRASTKPLAGAGLGLGLAGEGNASGGSASLDWPSLAAAYLGLRSNRAPFPNLLPLGERWQPKPAVRPPAYALGATATLLALTLAAHGWIERALYGRALDQAIHRLEGAAQQVKRRQQETGAIEARAGVLAALQEGNGQKLRLLEQLTKLLPDGAWLQELHINEDTVEIYGFADRAADLVPPLENSPYFSQVEFTAPITRDNKNKELFRMRMRLRH